MFSASPARTVWHCSMTEGMNNFYDGRDLSPDPQCGNLDHERWNIKATSWAALAHVPNFPDSSTTQQVRGWGGRCPEIRAGQTVCPLFFCIGLNGGNMPSLHPVWIMYAICAETSTPVYGPRLSSLSNSQKYKKLLDRFSLFCTEYWPRYIKRVKQKFYNLTNLDTNFVWKGPWPTSDSYPKNTVKKDVLFLGDYKIRLFARQTSDW